MPDLYLALLHYNHIGMLATVMYRREIFGLVGGFDVRLRAAVDYELYLRIARRFPIRRYSQLVAEYRKYGASLSSDPALMIRAITRVFRREKRYIGSRPEYQDAWSQGIKGNGEYYLKLLRLQVQSSRMMDVSWGRRARVAAALLRWDTRGFVKAFVPRLYCGTYRWGNAIRNAMIRLTTFSTPARGVIAAAPNPIRIPTACWEGPGSTIVDWQTTGTRAVEVRVNDPQGPLFSGLSPDGSASTGNWVMDGTRFYLQDVSETDVRGSGRTLAVVTVNVIPK
jgi:hypothetical protein